MRKKRFRARHIYAAAIATGMLLVFTAASFEHSLAQLLNGLRRTLITSNDLLLLDAVLNDTKDIERGSSGFIITRNEAFLKPFDRGSRALAADSAILAQSMRNEPDTFAELARAEADTDRFLTLSRHIVGLASGKSSTQAGAAVASLGQLQLAQQIESSISRLRNEELEDLAIEHRMVRQETRHTVLLGMAALAMMMALLTFVVMAMRREIIRRTASKNDAAQANQQLTERVEELNRHSIETALLSELSEMLQVCDSIDEVEELLPQFGVRLFPQVDGTLYTSAQNALEAAASWGSDLAAPSFAPTDCWAVRLGRSHFASIGATTLHCRHTTESVAEAALCVPMISQGETLGVLCLRGDLAAFATGDLEKTAKSVVDQMSLGLANLRLHETLRSRAMRDPLTSLFNRRYMEESLANCIQAAQRQGGHFAVLMLDVDHFKRYNDTFGHAGGDAALQHLARCMTSRFRETDILCRFGGEEFFVIMPDADLTIAAARAEELRRSASSLDIRLNGQLLDKLTISAGVAVYPDHAVSSTALIAAADNALYEAKRRGRDRVVVAELLRQELIAV